MPFGPTLHTDAAALESDFIPMGHNMAIVADVDGRRRVVMQLSDSFADQRAQLVQSLARYRNEGKNPRPYRLRVDGKWSAMGPLSILRMKSEVK